MPAGLQPAYSQGHRDLGEIEKEHIRGILASSGGDVKKTAEILNMSRATLYRKLKKYRIS